MNRPVLLLTTLCLLAGHALAQERPRVVRPPANLKEATVQRWLKANVEPGDFVFAAYDDEAAYYLQPALNQAPSAKPMRVWVRSENFDVDSEGVRSSLSLYDFDCAEQRSRILALDSFGELNLERPLSSVDLNLEDETQWEYMRPDSFGEEIQVKVCALKVSQTAEGGAP